MTLSSIAIQVLFSVGLTCLMGTIMVGLWSAATVFLKKRSNAEFIYLLLRIAVLGFFIPWLSTARLFHKHVIGGSTGWLPHLTSQMAAVVVLVFALWLMGACGVAGVYLVRYYRFCKLLRHVCQANVDKQKILEETCRKLNIRRKVYLCSGYAIMVPCIRGIWHIRLYLPSDEMTDAELRMTLEHELNHYKQGDTFWKLLMVGLTCVFWFMPVVRYVKWQMHRWSEASCDYKCYRGGCSLTDYFESIMRLGERTIQNSTFTPALKTTAGELKWRICCMKNSRDKKLERWVAILLTVILVLTSATATYAADFGFERIYDRAFEATVYEIDETEVYLSTELPEYEEFTATREEMFADTIVQQQLLVRSSSKWTIKSGYAKETAAFHKDAGGQVYVTGYIEPDNKGLTLGISQPGGTTRAIKVSGQFTFTFTNLEYTGDYTVFIKNNSGSTVTVEMLYN